MLCYANMSIRSPKAEMKKCKAKIKTISIPDICPTRGTGGVVLRGTSLLLQPSSKNIGLRFSVHAIHDDKGAGLISEDLQTLQVSPDTLTDENRSRLSSKAPSGPNIRGYCVM